MTDEMIAGAIPSAAELVAFAAAEDEAGRRRQFMLWLIPEMRDFLRRNAFALASGDEAEFALNTGDIFNRAKEQWDVYADEIVSLLKGRGYDARVRRQGQTVTVLVKIVAGTSGAESGGR